MSREDEGRVLWSYQVLYCSQSGVVLMQAEARGATALPPQLPTSTAPRYGSLCFHHKYLSSYSVLPLVPVI